MATTPERPSYFEGQYLGSADLAAAVDYARQTQRTTALAGQSWGIHIGLDLVEQVDTDGGTSYYVMPGCATDGYGRLIVVGAPAPVPSALFASLPTGSQMVWIRYDQGGHQGLRPGWQTCGDQDQFARIQESFGIEAGPLEPLDRRQSGVNVAGIAVPDGREALNKIDSDAPYLCDGSLPFQDYPADDARWLVPLGVASWTAGAPGTLGARSVDLRKVSRTFRRYAGQVAETIHAADGVIRLRDRFTDKDGSKSAEEQCKTCTIKVEDLDQAKNASGTVVDRLIGRELVWIEGHSRMLGDARLWGSKLDFRTSDGGTADSPMYLVRGDNTKGGSLNALELALGSAADGNTRLIAGPIKAGTVDTRLQFINDGRLVVGSPIPPNVKKHSILATTGGDTSIAVAAGAGKVAKLEFNVGGGLSERASLAYDDNARVLRFGLGADLTLFSAIDAQGRVGIRTLDNNDADSDADDLLVLSDDATGVTLLSGEGNTGRINFGDKSKTDLRPHSGSIVYRNSIHRMDLWTDGDPRLSITSTGRIGIGTTSPAALVQIENPTDNRRLKLDADSIRAEDGGSGTLLTLQSSGGGLQVGANCRIDENGRIGVATTTPAAALHVAGQGSQLLVDASPSGEPRLTLRGGGSQTDLRHSSTTNRLDLINQGTTALTANGGRIGVNLGNDAPVAELHVRGNHSDSANNITAHVALIENTAGGNADVLALKVNIGTAQSDNNFITFFAGNTACGAIEGNGAGGVTLNTSGADFAERLPRAGAEPIGPGMIVGLHGGKVALDTEVADSLHVTTDRAAVLGNVGMLPIALCENVALLGQVPVKIRGPVRAGERIVPSGGNDGIGRAAGPDDGPQRAIGRAWTDWQGDGLGEVIVAVGLADAPAARDLAGLVEHQQRCIETLLERVERLEAARG